MVTRKAWDVELARLARRLSRDEVHADSVGLASIRYFYCTGVMGVVRLLRRLTRAKDVQAQHDMLKILFARHVHGDRARFEARRGKYRLDIVVDGERRLIEMKTLVDMTIEKLKKAALLAIKQSDAKKAAPDEIWLAYFYKFRGNKSPTHACKYILTFVALDLAGSPDMGSVNEQVATMVQKSKKEVADKLGVDNAIIIPVENIVLVEELEREVKDLEAVVEEKEERMDQLEDDVATKDKVISEKDKALSEKDKALSEKDKEIQRLRDELARARRGS